MSVLAAFMVPHPPLIIPEIGKGKEKKIQKTVDSYEAVAREIAALKPDTIIICSPHKETFSDYFLINGEDNAEGSFEEFGAADIRIRVKCDTEFVKAVEDACLKENVMAGTAENDVRQPLDHGTMIPLWFIGRYLDKFNVVNVGISGFSLLEHYHLGVIMARTAEKLCRRTVFVASGDLSHKLKEDGPYGFDDDGPVYDDRLMDLCKRGALGEMLDFPQLLCQRSAECGHRPFCMMSGFLDGKTVKSRVYSHEDVTGVGYGICSFYPDGNSDERKFRDIKIREEELSVAGLPLSDEPYVRLAQRAIYGYVISGRHIQIPDDVSEDMLGKQAGVFVSIHQFDHLRGCIGTIAPTRENVAAEIIRNAVLAASSDYRFLPLREFELDSIEISVDVLGEIEDISSQKELDVRRYGVIVRKDDREGLLLPNLDGITSVRQQVAIAKQKAGIDSSERVSLQRFEVVRHYQDPFAAFEHEYE